MSDKKLRIRIKEKDEILSAQADKIKMLERALQEKTSEIEELRNARDEAISCFTRMENLYEIKCKELKTVQIELIEELIEKYSNYLKKMIKC